MHISTYFESSYEEVKIMPEDKPKTSDSPDTVALPGTLRSAASCRNNKGGKKTAKL
jgi:hypothetical protein